MIKNININIVLLNNDAQIPKKQHEIDIGYDLFSCKEYKLEPKKITIINTGISIELPINCGGFVLPRSGLAAKHGITSINSPGLIDPGYTGEIKVPLINHSDNSYDIKSGDRFAQLVFINVNNADFNEVEKLNNTIRADKGFGSTG